jgi:DNA-directed RNA polymerase specialized sigma24 family protein
MAAVAGKYVDEATAAAIVYEAFAQLQRSSLKLGRRQYLKPWLYTVAIGIAFSIKRERASTAA